MKHIKIKLSFEEREEVEKIIKEERDIKIARRFLCLRSLDNGINKTQTAEFLDVSMETIHNWLLIFQEGGFDALRQLNYEGRRPSALEPHKEELEEYIKTNIVIGYNQVADFVNKTFDVGLTYYGIRDFVKKNSIQLSKNQKNFRLNQQRKKNKTSS